MLNNSGNGNIWWYSFGSVIGLVKYFWTLDIDPTQVSASVISVAVLQSIVVALFAGAATYAGKELMRMLFTYIKKKINKP